MAANSDFISPTEKQIQKFLGKEIPRNSWEIIGSISDIGLVVIGESKKYEEKDKPRVSIPEEIKGAGFILVKRKVVRVIVPFRHIEEIFTDKVAIGHTVDRIFFHLGDVVVESLNPPLVTPSYEGFALRMNVIRGYKIISYINGILMHENIETGETYIKTNARWGKLHHSEAIPHLPKFTTVFPGCEDGIASFAKTEFFSWNCLNNQTGSRIWYTAGPKEASLTIYYEFRTDVKDVDGFEWSEYYADNSKMNIDAQISEHVGPRVPPTFATVAFTPEENLPTWVNKINHLLREGLYYMEKIPENYPDIFLPGEALIMSFGDKTYRVIPQSWNWRNNVMRAGNPSIKDRMFHIFGMDLYSGNFLPISTRTGKGEDIIQSIKKLLEEGTPFLYGLPKDSFEEATNSMKKVVEESLDVQKVKFLNYLFSLPPGLQFEAVNLWTYYVYTKKAVFKLLHYLYRNEIFYKDPNPKDEPHVPSIGTILVNKVSDFAGKRDEKNREIKAQKGVDNRIFNVADVDVPPGKRLILRRHGATSNEAKNIVASARSYIEKHGKGKSKSEQQTTITQKFKIELNKLNGEQMARLYREATGLPEYVQPDYINPE